MSILGTSMCTLYVYIFLEYMHYIYSLFVTRQNHWLSIRILCQHLPWNIFPHVLQMFAFAIFALASWLQPKNFEPARQTPGAPRRTPPTLGAGRWWSRRTRRWHPTWLLPLAVTGPSSCPQNQARANIWTTSCGWWKLCECVNLYKQEYIDYMYICFTYYIDFDIHIIYHSIPYFLNSIKFFRYKQCNRLWQKYGHMQSEVSCFE